MKKKIIKEKGITDNNENTPRIWISPHQYILPYNIQVFGSDWGICPITLWVDGKNPVSISKYFVGYPSAGKLKPDAGMFHVMVSIPELSKGKHTITVVPDDKQNTKAMASFEIENIAATDKSGRPTNRWAKRILHFQKERFPNGINKLPGSRLRALEHRDKMRLRRQRTQFDKAGDFSAEESGPDSTSPPVDPGCNWYSIGPSVVRKGQVFSTTTGTYTTAPISGRVTSIAYDPNNADIIYIGTAQGGVWKSVDGGLNWRAKSDFEASLAIGCVVVDASAVDASGNATRIIAGTGEPNFSDSYYGAGILFSSNGGNTWENRGAVTFARAAISSIAVDPANNQHFYLSSDIGLYESVDEGVNWNLLEAGQFYDLTVDWANAGGAEIYAGKLGVGIRRSQNSGTSFTTLGGGLPAASSRVALAMAPGNPDVLYAAIALAATVLYKTTNGGTTWTPLAMPPGGIGQSSYNLVLGIHPTNSNTVLFGAVYLWRTTDGGTTWNYVCLGSPGIHADQHAIAFHRTDGNKVYIGNDGGVFYSTDGGVTYVHRNKDLATLQYFGIANHPNYDAVMLGGSQDNGAHRYSGHPAWEHSALGDGAFAAIDSNAATFKWYETRWYSFPCFRSDSAGSLGSWNLKTTGIATNSNWFYPPLVMDPNNSAVLYSGYDKLFRTANNADSWTAITASSLVSASVNITAIAVAPSDSNTVYVGMQDGKVFKITFSGGVWSSTNITVLPLPVGQISDIAVHPTNKNIVYITTSNLIFSEGGGEVFNNDHVFRSPDGGTTWQNISTGLSQANPVNCIVIDPDNPTTLFIGCDVGIFRSNNEGGIWNAWDSGLPNCSVQDLTFYRPKRLLRAATHGRSVWERPVDALTYPLVDVYLRDDFVDTGLTLPTQSGVAHPFTAGGTVSWYQSVDIKVDSPDPVTGIYQTPTRNIDYIQFEEILHDNPRRETWVRVYVQVHNRGNNPATNVQVRPFFANAGGGLPDLPADFWTVFPLADPADMSIWRPVGPARVISSLYPGQPQIVSWSWFVPADAANHTCMFCAVKSAEDNVTTSSLNIGQAVTMDNNVTLKNLHVENLVPGSTGIDEGSAPYFIDFAAFHKEKTFDIRIYAGALPKGTRLHVFFPAFQTKRPLKESVQGMRITKRKQFTIKKRPEEICGETTKYNTEQSFVMDFSGKPVRGTTPGIYGIIPEERKFSAAFYIDLPKGVRPGQQFSLNIEQWIENELAGGSSYEFRIQKKK